MAQRHVHLTSRADLERACDVLTRMHAPCLPMLRAAADGVIALVIVSDQGAKFPERLMAKAGRPVLLVVGDDLEPERPSSPPSAWRCARMLRAWAKSAIVHGAGGEAEHYRTAVAVALVTGRATLIETSSACTQPWGEFLAPTMPVLKILPRIGPHPISPRREVMQ